jgi:outer membrane protein assembly factor BamB
MSTISVNLSALLSTLMGAFPTDRDKLWYYHAVIARDEAKTLEERYRKKFLTREYVSSEDFNLCLKPTAELYDVTEKLLDILENSGFKQTVIAKDAIFDAMICLAALFEKKAGDYVMSSDWSSLNRAIWQIYRVFRDLNLSRVSWLSPLGDLRGSGNVRRQVYEWNYFTVMTDAGAIAVIDRDLSILTKKRLGSEGTKYYCQPAVDDEGNIYTVIDSTLYGMTTDGNVFLSLSLPFSVEKMMAPAIFNDGTVVVTSENGDMARISSSGEIIWHLKDTVPSSFLYYHRPVIGEDGVIYDFLGGSDVGRLYAVDPNGQIIWYADVGKPPYSPPAYMPCGMVAFRSYEWMVFIDKESNVRIRMNTPDPTWSPTAYYNGIMFWGDKSGMIWGVDEMGIPSVIFLTDILTNGRAVTPISISGSGHLVFRDEGGYISVVKPDGSDYLTRYQIGADTTFPLATYDEKIIFAYRLGGSTDYTDVWITDLNFEEKRNRAFDIAGSPVLSHSLI